ncbi:MAG: choice-of-anchor J domain-containing protein [Flavobacteriales bacterium]|nr:choice-of-anchor J domain-containing protein [Flavobacteriales bacterium]
MVHASQAQTHLKPLRTNEAPPSWFDLMVGEDPDVPVVVAAYEEWCRTHPSQKTVYTQYFKRWITSVQNKLGTDGRLEQWTAAEREQRTLEVMARRQERGGGGWTYAGPEIHYRADGSLQREADHANVYCHDRSATDPNILFAGTESGGLYKSVDQGQTWSHVSSQLIVGAVSAVRIHPADPDIVLMSAENELWRSIDGGANWAVIGQPSFVSLNISAWEFAFHPLDPQIILAACNLGMFRSTDGGDNWTEVLPNECMSIVHKPFEPDVWYTLHFEPTLNLCKFQRSLDQGATWTMYDQGWFSPPTGEQGLYAIEGGRLAVSEADPERIYALLVGYQQTGASITTNGYVGVWRSNDGGLNWYHPHGVVGAPYNTSHPNLMNFQGDDGTYTQIHYNTTICASQLDADKVLIGGLNLWQSNNGCLSYTAKAGYVGTVQGIHVDMQELRIYRTGPATEEVWLSNDGGIHRSTTFMDTHDILCKGIRAVNLWGYDQGWNEDIMVGGRYHNGNMAYYEGYPAGEFLALGGAESPTGYVNFSNERKVYHSDIGGRVLPTTLSGTPQSFGVGLWPNESYFVNNSSRIAFDQQYYNVAYMGRDNKLYRSENGGGSWSMLHTFGTNVSHRVLWFEQSYADPQVMVVQQVQGSVSRLWRTADGGATWTMLTLPLSQREIYFSLGGEDPQTLWLGFTNGSNGNKIYKSTDGGASWSNLTTAALNNERIWGVAAQFRTDGGVYLAMRNGGVYYRNNSMPDWDAWGNGLPVSTEPIRIAPFYKGEKVRLATWNLGVWERGLYEPSAIKAEFAAAFGLFFCPGDTVRFVDHSVAGPTATHEWSFPGGTPSTSTDPYPAVVYSAPGSYDITLTITQGGLTSTVTKTAFISDTPGGLPPVVEGFESGGFPEGWTFRSAAGTTSAWAITNTAGGFGQSANSMWFNNYDIDIQGGREDVWLKKTSFTGVTNGYVAFDVAYAPYGGIYSDTLAVRVSTDCGATWSQMYLKGGAQLSTAPANQSLFTPTATQWRRDSISLSGFDGADEVLVAFQNRGHWGNAIYVDNINLSAPGISSFADRPAQALVLFPNPASEEVFVRWGHTSQGPVDVILLDATGRTVRSLRASGNQARMDLAGLSAGLFVVEVKDGESVWRTALVKH